MDVQISFSKKRVNFMLVPWVVSLVIFFAGHCEAKTAQAVQKTVEDSVSIRQETQKKDDEWEQERAELIHQFEQLQEQNRTLEKENLRLIRTQKDQSDLNLTLSEQKKESLKIQKELLPFLEEVFTRIETMIQGDTPFLEEERTERLSRLKEVLADPEISMASKYRKVMEALFIEAEYGSTIEVYQDKILLSGNEVLGDIFRLGRVSLFFLSLDQSSAAYFNVADGSWQPLSEHHVLAVRSAVEIGKKRRSVELLPLPLGRLAAGEGTVHE